MHRGFKMGLLITTICAVVLAQESTKPLVFPPPPSAPPPPASDVSAVYDFNTLAHFLENPDDERPPQRIDGVIICGCEVTPKLRFGKDSAYALDLVEPKTGASISGFDPKGASAVVHDEQLACAIIARLDLSGHRSARVFYTLWQFEDEPMAKGCAMVVNYVEWLDSSGEVIDRTEQDKRSF
jgi:hypothetical protein